MGKECKYRDLESKMLKLEDYRNIPVLPVAEQLVPIVGNAMLSATIIRDDAVEVTGSKTYVREGVLDRLIFAASKIYQATGLTLDVGYGYRSLEVKKTVFRRL